MFMFELSLWNQHCPTQKSLIRIISHFPLRMKLCLHSPSVFPCLRHTAWQRALAIAAERQNHPSLPAPRSGKGTLCTLVSRLAPPSWPRGDSSVYVIWKALRQWTGLIPPGQPQGKSFFFLLPCEFFWGKLDGSRKSGMPKLQPELPIEVFSQYFLPVPVSKYR